MKVFPIQDKINEYDYDPDLGAGIPWIRRTSAARLTHTLLQLGLTTPQIGVAYELKVRSENNDILKINLEKEV